METGPRHRPILQAFAPLHALTPTYPDDTDEGIKLGFQRGPLLRQGQAVVPAR